MTVVGLLELSINDDIVSHVFVSVSHVEVLLFHVTEVDTFVVFVNDVVGFEVLVMLICCFDTLLPSFEEGHCFYPRSNQPFFVSRILSLLKVLVGLIVQE